MDGLESQFLNRGWRKIQKHGVLQHLDPLKSYHTPGRLAKKYFPIHSENSPYLYDNSTKTTLYYQ